ncbi:GNAT family N-acetyltransferase [Pseudomonas sp. LTJR-52]|uniref:GNAT family N-acetyltransferase n=1 Tax=Pseudomonas sp. LTJR-52 TaxID=2479392 RepID=UPI001C49B9C3
MIRAIEQRCIKKDCSKIMLMSSIHRTQAHAFFKRAGFKGDSKRGFVKYRRDLLASGLPPD